MTAPVPSPFTALERRVIRIGRCPGEPAEVISDAPPGRWERARRMVLGHRPAMPLSDARLEALRAMAAALRDRPLAPDPQVVHAFLAAGWRPADIDAIRHLQ